MQNAIRIKVKKRIGNYAPGSIVRVPLDGEGIIMDKFWRRRVADAKTDGCCEVIQNKPPVKETAKSPTGGGKGNTAKKAKTKSSDIGD